MATHEVTESAGIVGEIIFGNQQVTLLSDLL
jgi:hypothetical protein